MADKTHGVSGLLSRVFGRNYGTVDSVVAYLRAGSACVGISIQRLWNHQSGHPGEGNDGAGRAASRRSLRNVRRAISGNRGWIWTSSGHLSAMVCPVVVRLSGSRHVHLPFLLAGV